MPPLLTCNCGMVQWVSICWVDELSASLCVGTGISFEFIKGCCMLFYWETWVRTWILRSILPLPWVVVLCMIAVFRMFAMSSLAPVE